MIMWCSICEKNTETHQYSWSNVCVDCGRIISEDTFDFHCDRNKVLNPVNEHKLFHPVKDTPKIWCSYCGLKCDTYLCCAHCGKVVAEHSGILWKGTHVINKLVDIYGITSIGDAFEYFKIAVKREFTRGRKVELVAVACFYLACREMVKPILLIQFADDFGVNVYKLAVMYLQLCELLGLQDHPVVQNPVDPTFFMHRYTSGLMKDDNNTKVWSTALLLAVRMKSDWIRAGRKPSGIYAAAIYVSSMLHGYNFSKTDVVEVVQRCDATLSKRLISFGNTESGSITIEELTKHAMDFNWGMLCASNMPHTEVVCEHKSSAAAQSDFRLCGFGFGLCEDCYLEFRDGSESPAFQPGEIIHEKICIPEFAAQVVASTKPRKAKRKRELEAKPATSAESQHINKKLSSKINYDAWTRLFGDEESSLVNNVDDGEAKGNEIKSDHNDDDDDDDDDDDEDGDGDGGGGGSGNGNWDWIYDIGWDYDDEWDDDIYARMWKHDGDGVYYI